MIVRKDFDFFVSQGTPLSDSRFAWYLDFSPQPTIAFLRLAGQRQYTTCSMDSKYTSDLLLTRKDTPSLFRTACVAELPGQL